VVWTTGGFFDLYDAAHIPLQLSHELLFLRMVAPDVVKLTDHFLIGLISDDEAVKLGALMVLLLLHALL